jgi:LysM repeat protein
MVQPGETAMTIAAKYGMSVSLLLGLNRLSGAEDIQPGRIITVVDKAGAHSTAVSAPAPVPGKMQLTPDIPGISPNALAGGSLRKVAAADAGRGVDPLVDAATGAVPRTVSTQERADQPPTPESAPESAIKMPGFRTLRTALSLFVGTAKAATLPNPAQQTPGSFSAPAPTRTVPPAQTGDTRPAPQSPVRLPAATATERLPLIAEPYMVQSGETAATIAAKYGMSVPQLLGLNRLSGAEDIQPGRTITVVGKAGANRAAVSTPAPVPGKMQLTPDIPGISPNALAGGSLGGFAAAAAGRGVDPLVDAATGAVPRTASTQERADQPPAPEPAIKMSGFGTDRAAVANPQGQSAAAAIPVLQGQPKDNTGKMNAEGAADSALPPDENIQKFREIVEDSSWQEVTPNKRSFVQLSRYFVNQISCPGGKFVQALMPQDKFVETELSENGSDFFLRVGNNPDKQFPLDLVLICEDQTFMLNAVVHTGVPSQQVRLRLPKKAKEKADLNRAKPMIEQAQALPQEEQLIRIARRVYKEDYLSYWETDASAVSRHKWYVRPYTIVVNNVVKTYINGYVAWDFLVKGIGDGSEDGLRRELQRAVRGRPVAIGKVGGHTVARYIVITQDTSDGQLIARKGGVR